MTEKQLELFLRYVDYKVSYPNSSYFERDMLRIAIKEIEEELLKTITGEQD